MLSEEELFSKIGDSYLGFNFPNEIKPKDVNTIIQYQSLVSDKTINNLIVGESWRERIVGTLLAANKNITLYQENLYNSIIDSRGSSLPHSIACLAISIKKFWLIRKVCVRI